MKEWVEMKMEWFHGVIMDDFIDFLSLLSP